MNKLIIPSLLNVGEVISMADYVLKTTEIFIATDPRMNQLHQNLLSDYNRLVKNQKYSPQSLHTLEVINRDKRRDRGFISFRDIVQGLSLSLIDEVATLAVPLYALIEKYGTQLYSLGYQAESSLLKSMFADFDKPENQEKLVTLNIIQFYDALKTAEAEFIAISSLKTEEKSATKQDQEAAGDVAPEVISDLTKLVALLQVYAEVETTIYGTAYQNIATFIAETTATARARKTRKGNNGDNIEPNAPKN
jgi:hypothetical protein